MTQVACPACETAPAGATLNRGGTAFNRCPACATQWRPEGATFCSYDTHYFRDRAHDDTESPIGRAKLETFRRFWGTIASIQPPGPVLEIGCSTGTARHGQPRPPAHLERQPAHQQIPLLKHRDVGPLNRHDQSLADGQLEKRCKSRSDCSTDEQQEGGGE